MELPNRKSIRLQGWDYANEGYYFVTIDTWQKIKYFGQIVGGKMILNGYGNILAGEIVNTPKIRLGVTVDTYQIMPDHLHIILKIRQDDGGKQNLGYIIRGIKMATAAKISKRSRGAMHCARTKNVWQYAGTNRIWQRNFYERIIRNELELNRIRRYIIDNPKNWEK